VSYLYVAKADYQGDAGDYSGHGDEDNLSTGAQVVFNTRCATSVHFVETPGQSPVCPTAKRARSGESRGVTTPHEQRFIYSCGNARFAPSGLRWGDTVLALVRTERAPMVNPLEPTLHQLFQSLGTIWTIEPGRRKHRYGILTHRLTASSNVHSPGVTSWQGWACSPDSGTRPYEWAGRNGHTGGGELRTDRWRGSRGERCLTKKATGEIRRWFRRWV